MIRILKAQMHSFAALKITMMMVIIKVDVYLL